MKKDEFIAAFIKLVNDNWPADVTAPPVMIPPQAMAIDPADILVSVSADLPFNAQPFAKGPGGGGSKLYVDVLGNSPGIHDIPENGKHGSPLPPNGETLRFGKQVDPLNPTRKALVFQLAPSDGQKHVELGQSNSRTIVPNQVNWIAVSAYVYDWGTLTPKDQALFGFQLHTGSSADISPTIALYAVGNGRRMQIQTRYSLNASPSQSNQQTQFHADRAIPFGRWMDVVVKFKENTAGQGFAQVWLDGEQIVDYHGNLGFIVPAGVKDFVKFGYYNWTSFSSPRKVLLRSPTLVLDPTGSKYTPADLRAFINK